VVAIGPEAARASKFRLGKRVFGAVHGSNPMDLQSGSFAEYVAIDIGFLFRVPDYVSFETAAAIGGTGLGTLGLALYRFLGLTGTPWHPADKEEYVLVYGGSTSVGTLALQLLRL
jgi:NADPH:quinone reductase-like Zn-dependent oxidoreductase